MPRRSLGTDKTRARSGLILFVVREGLKGVEGETVKIAVDEAVKAAPGGGPLQATIRELEEENRKLKAAPASKNAEPMRAKKNGRDRATT
jgi:hypothetical protein